MIYVALYLAGLLTPAFVVLTLIALSLHGMRGLEYDPTSTPPGPREEWL